MCIYRELLSLQNSIYFNKHQYMEIKTSRKKEKLLPGLNMTHREFLTRVHKAEEGPFYTLEEFNQKMQEWKKRKYGL